VYRYWRLAFIGLVLGGCATYTATSGHVVLKDDRQAAEVHFSDSDIALIKNYYSNPANRQTSSADVKITVGDALPPGIMTQRVPHALERKLSPLPSSYIRLRVGQAIVLMDRKTRVVEDVLYGVED
jgi:hypothetical protein